MAEAVLRMTEFDRLTREDHGPDRLGRSWDEYRSYLAGDEGALLRCLTLCLPYVRHLAYRNYHRTRYDVEEMISLAAGRLWEGLKKKELKEKYFPGSLKVFLLRHFRAAFNFCGKRMRVLPHDVGRIRVRSNRPDIQAENREFLREVPEMLYRQAANHVRFGGREQQVCLILLRGMTDGKPVDLRRFATIYQGDIEFLRDYCRLILRLEKEALIKECGSEIFEPTATWEEELHDDGGGQE